MPGSGRRGRFLRCAARRGAIATKPAALQHRLGPGVAQRKPVLGLQRFVKMLHREVPVACPILLHHKLDPVHRRPPPRGAPAPAIDQALCAFCLVPVAQPAEVPLADPEQLGRLDTAQPPAPMPLQCLQIPRHPYLRSYPDPPVWKTSKNRTDRLLPNPDISSATDNVKVGS